MYELDATIHVFFKRKTHVDATIDIEMRNSGGNLNVKAEVMTWEFKGVDGLVDRPVD